MMSLITERSDREPIARNRSARKERERPGYDGVFEDSLASAVRGLAAQGTRTMLVTSCMPGEGKSTVTAHLGYALARSGLESVVVVDADSYRPSLRKVFGLRGNRGLGELISETYLENLSHRQPIEVGVGDWIEVLRGQRRTGDLTVREGDRTFIVRFSRGSLSCLVDAGSEDARRLGDRLLRRGQVEEAQLEAALRMQKTTGRMLGDLLTGLGAVPPDVIATALREQAMERAHELVSLAQPECSFQELVDPYLPASGGRAPATPVAVDLDAVLEGRVRQYLRDPFLSNQVSSCLSDTAFRNLKILPQGPKPSDFLQAQYLAAFPLLIERLARTFDLVLVDAPPISLTTPTAALARHVAAVLMVVKAGSVHRRTLRRGLKELRRNGANVAGVVLNQVNVAGDEMLSPFYRVAYSKEG